MTSTTKVKEQKFSFKHVVEKLYNKTVIDFNFGRHKDLSTLKSDIQLGLMAWVNSTFWFKHILLARTVNIIKHMLTTSMFQGLEWKQHAYRIPFLITNNIL